jgi:hypothetical protein
MEFKPFEKIARLKRECTITEKIDGTNAQICIVPIAEADNRALAWSSREADGLAMYAGSRTRWITPEDDNFGFAGWVKTNADQLWSLGPGQHFGEWWGGKVQRGYGLAEKQFSLFNVVRWNKDNQTLPACCSVVPHLYTGPFTTDVVDLLINDLATNGSKAAPGFMKPEGVVVYLHAARTMFKVTVEGDSEPKEARARRLAHEAKMADALAQ